MCWHRAWKASSHRWHPRSVDIAIRTLRYLVRNEKRLLRAVSNMSEYFRTRLGAMRFAGDAEIRVVGLAIGIDLHDEKAAERLGKRCRRKGLLVSPGSPFARASRGDALTKSPPAAGKGRIEPSRPKHRGPWGR